MNESSQLAGRPADSGTLVTASQKTKNGAATRAATLAPAIDVFEYSHGITVFAGLPGVTKEKLDIKVHDGTLLIEAEAVVPTPSELRLQHAEIRKPHFFRAFTLSADLDASRIDAQLRDGVLRLMIPRRDEARPRRIEVAAG